MTMAATITKTEAVEAAGATGLCAGAQLRTPCGGRRVEFLRPGDLVVTRDDGLQPVRAVWTRTVTAAEMSADPSLAPIVLRPRAIGPMMPQRTLSVGAGHRLLIPGWRLEGEADTDSCLVPARDVAGLNDASFVDRTPDEIVYYNVVFDAYQVVSANGLPVETFQPTPEVLAACDREVRDTIETALPDLETRTPQAPSPRYKIRERVSYRPEFA